MNYERVTIKSNDKNVMERLASMYESKFFLSEVNGDEISLRNKQGATSEVLQDFSSQYKDTKILGVFAFESDHYELVYKVEYCNGKYKLLDEAGEE